ncbi:hypothetical protein [Ferrimonas sp.]|uniref:hypothetical protein n=1 Tax=Ferrimonas sp. TaxID=2080861 RepID=UPI003A8FEF6B
MNFKLSIFTATLLSCNVFAEDAILCDSCTSYEAARNQAEKYAPELECHNSGGGDPSFGPSMTCGSTAKRITLVSSLSGATYSFDVYHENVEPWSVVVSTKSVSADAEYVFRELAKFHRTLTSSIREAEKEDISYSSPSLYSAQTESNCPTGTALDTLADPNKLEQLMTKMELQISTNYMSHNNRANVNPRAYASGYAGGYKGFSYSVTHEASRQVPTYVETFDFSERPNTGVKDRLVFRVGTFGTDENNIKSLTFDLIPDASRVGGYTLSGLQGKNGTLKVDNACIREKLDELAQQQAVTLTVTPVGGGGGVPSLGTPGETLTNPTKTTCKIYDYRSSGMLIASLLECE